MSTVDGVFNPPVTSRLLCKWIAQGKKRKHQTPADQDRRYDKRKRGYPRSQSQPIWDLENLYSMAVALQSYRPMHTHAAMGCNPPPRPNQKKYTKTKPRSLPPLHNSCQNRTRLARSFQRQVDLTATYMSMSTRE